MTPLDLAPAAALSAPEEPATWLDVDYDKQLVRRIRDVRSIRARVA